MESAEKSSPQNPDYDIILLGKARVGKSATGNTLLGETAFSSKMSVKPVTEEVQKERMTFDGVTLDVYDTPGFNHPGTKDKNYKSELKNLLSHTTRPVILLVMKADGVSPEDEQLVNVIEEVIPECLVQNTWILFTRGDELERDNLSIEEFIEDSAELKEIVQRCGNRYHVFNNFSESPEQVRTLIHQIRETAQDFSPSIGNPQTRPRDHRRIVLLGKTGAGKSATGNTILEEPRFKSETSPSSITTKTEIQHAVVSGRKISVVDTPGLFDTKLSRTQLAEQIGRSIYEARPGPHAFLYVQPVNIRFTKQEEDVLQKLELSFGKNLHKYTIVIFTFGDLLKEKSVEEFIQENRSLSALVDQCGGRYHLMNNKQKKEQQVTDLLEKIDRMVQDNGGNHYTSQMFEKAQRFKTFKEFFYACKKSLLLAAVVCSGGGVLGGAAIGIAVGVAVGGPIGAGVGAGVGAVLGTATGSGIGARMHKRNKQKSRSAAHNENEEGSVPKRDDTEPGTVTEKRDDTEPGTVTEKRDDTEPGTV